MTTFQPMPDLTPDQLAALRADIKANGILVPVIHDQHGRTIDGHNREAIGSELGITVPVEVREVTDDDEAATLALTLNCARRHLTREQTREVIAREIERRPGDSDRAIARRVGCSPSTVGAVRRPAEEVSNLDTLRVQAEESTRQAKEGLAKARNAVATLIAEALTAGASRGDVMLALQKQQQTFRTRVEKSEYPVEMVDVFRWQVYEPLTAMLLEDDVLDVEPVPNAVVRDEMLTCISDLWLLEVPADSPRTGGA